MINNIQYYNDNINRYKESIKNVDVSDILQDFLSLFPKKSLILDAGCGTGRDSKYMLDHDFLIYPFDASIEMVKEASEILDYPVELSTFEEIILPENYFDGIWAMASLLHVPKENIKSVFIKLYNSLKSGGYFYCSFKYGEDFLDENRSFTCFNEKSFVDSIGLDYFEIFKIWRTMDSRGTKNKDWLNVILKKN